MTGPAWRARARASGLVAFGLCVAACSGDGPTGELPMDCAADAPSTCLEPTQDDAYYADQGDKYFDTLDGSADPASVPTYSERVARWEWAPWLKLTGYGRDMIVRADQLVLVVTPDTTVPERDCRAFGVQPFGRCKVVMQIEGKPCPIYEEFTFNDQGEVTFVEAWSDLPGLRPMDDADPWAEAADVARLSTRIPGLGNDSGLIDPAGAAMDRAAGLDPEVADFQARALDFWTWWALALEEAGPDMYARGCGWPLPGDPPAAAR